jgi:chemotaxis protein CheX
MNFERIDPFVDAVINVLTTMAFTTPRTGQAFERSHKRASEAKGDVTAIIGMTGQINGSMAVSFSERAILQIVSNMFGEACKEIDDDIHDAVGELCNMISGDARRALEGKGISIQAAIPTVVSGRGHRITHAVSGPSTVIPFNVVEDAPFFIEICFDDNL